MPLMVQSSYRQLQAITGSYRQLQAVTSSYRQLQAVTSSYSAVTGSHKELQRSYRQSQATCKAVTTQS